MDELSKMQSISNRVDTVRDQSEVENATDSLDKGLYELSNLLSILEQRLAPVTRGANEKIDAARGSGATPMPQNSLIVMTLHNFTGRVQNEINKVNILLNSIQL